MKPKYPATALKQLALSGGLVGFEARAFAAFHSAVLDGSNHLDYVEAFVLQLGAPEQHEVILSLLSVGGRTFAHGRLGPSRRMMLFRVARWLAWAVGPVASKIEIQYRQYVMQYVERACRVDSGHDIGQCTVEAGAVEYYYSYP